MHVRSLADPRGRGVLSTACGPAISYPRSSSLPALVAHALARAWPDKVDLEARQPLHELVDR